MELCEKEEYRGCTIYQNLTTFGVKKIIWKTMLRISLITSNIIYKR